MKILVTGGSGFIGSHLIKALKKKGHKVVNLDFREPYDNKENWKFSDITSTPGNLFHTFKEHKFDVVYHLAAQTSVPHSVNNPEHDARTNILGTLNIIKMCEQFDSKLIFASTAASYGKPRILPIYEEDALDPQSPYGISKVACESYIRTSGVRHTVLRFANVYGYLGGGVINNFIFNAMNDIPLTVFGTGEQTRDYIYVKDLVTALIKCIDKGDGYTLNLSTMVQTPLIDIIGTLDVMFLDKILDVNYDKPRDGDIEDSVMSNSLAKQVLDWEPKYNIEVGIKDMLLEIRAQMIEEGK